MVEQNRRPKFAVIDYGMGNLHSVLRAWEKVGADPYLLKDPKDIDSAEALIFPGQGAISDTMKLIKSNGMDKLIINWIRSDKPFFGICLGLQALFEFSEEGNTECLGLFEGTTKRFQNIKGFKVPHMGWNNVYFKDSEITTGITSNKDQFYFVHSFYVEPKDKNLIFFESNYIINFCSGIKFGKNGYAFQFHPEKSQVKGLQLYTNFLKTIKS